MSQIAFFHVQPSQRSLPAAASASTDSFNRREQDLSQLLISVRNLEEARIVARHPIGILDVKEPSRGSLGAADPGVLLEIADSIEPDMAKSFSAGELSDWIGGRKQCIPNPLEDRYGTAILSQYRYVKVGLANTLRRFDWRTEWQNLFAALPSNTSPVLVAYLDHDRCDAPAPAEIIEFASKQPTCQAILFDTFNKHDNLFFHLSSIQLTQLVASAKQNRLMSVVAGSIDLECLEAVLDAGPDFVGIRGAVCRNRRTSEIDELRVRSFLKSARI